MKRRLMWGAIITLVGFPFLGWFILQFFENEPLQTIFRSEYALLLQIPVGVAVGYIFGKGAQYLVTRPFLKNVELKYSKLIRSFALNHSEIVFISLCAGIGEELLFRGALQPLLGIWPTAIIFVAIHGYLNPKDWKISVYGLFMTLAIAALGYLTDYVGIIAACMGHAMIDYVLFRLLVGEVDMVVDG